MTTRTDHITFKIAGATGQAIVHVRQNGDVYEDVSTQAERIAQAEGCEQDVSSAVKDERGNVVRWERCGIRVSA